MIWQESYRADPAAAQLADRHYNRQSVGSAQFVPPGRCLVLRAPGALWVTSWPFAEYANHAWAGAWVNSTIRRESGPLASDGATFDGFTVAHAWRDFEAHMTKHDGGVLTITADTEGTPAS